MICDIYKYMYKLYMLFCRSQLCSWPCFWWRLWAALREDIKVWPATNVITSWISAPSAVVISPAWPTVTIVTTSVTAGTSGDGHASWGPPSTVEWRHYAKSRTEQDVGVLSDINVQVIKRLYINSICFFFQTLFTIYIRYPMKSDHNKIGYICRLICTIRLIHRMNMNHYGYF